MIAIGSEYRHGRKAHGGSNKIDANVKIDKNMSPKRFCCIFCDRMKSEFGYDFFLKSSTGR